MGVGEAANFAAYAFAPASLVMVDFLVLIKIKFTDAFTKIN